MSSAPVIASIGLGANLGDAQTTVQRAIVALGSFPHTTVVAQSSLFRSAPIDAVGDDFVNAVAQLHTTLSAQQLLAELLQLEQVFGRERSHRNAPRTLDLDLLLFGQQEIDTATLTVPHPRLTQRAFTLIPLLQIDPLIVIPGRGAAHAFVPDVAGQSIQKII
ncbi:2-amino-4-hydroxy-6-hydroxymethyldihydropteridine diphosphokinase [Actimicrobium sp. GrIS 1.19]|uniref:2-amino-4-hydroxy-6- hydroxymethyldihydropteridine diphosphokinase n=1 Tax=Actimicrobium sp. GrIS 1.19 TaxID=3071708 RepID=UPI002E03ABA9|nr:2-amino-4-hydroxy-6-hydroxymethyldihydropteridine diphosphokinase [Actimicrobium sp. GrIS 1.19]